MQTQCKRDVERIPLFLSPQRQPHAVIAPGQAVPLFSEDFFTHLHQLAGSNQDPLPKGGALGGLLRELDAKAHSAGHVQPAPIRTHTPARGTLLIDLGDGFDAIEVDAKGWSIVPNLDTHFLRPAASYPLPRPEPSPEPLSACLSHLFRIGAPEAQQLADWLVCAADPEGRPPILVLTGEAAGQAAAKLRNLIDPVAQPLFPLPYGARQLGRLALSNRILAFEIHGKLTETRKAAFNALRRGMAVELKEANHRRPRIYGGVSRPIILAAPQPFDVGRHQLTIEINEAHPGDHPQILGALLDAISASLTLERRQFHDSLAEPAVPSPPPSAIDPLTRGP